MFMPNGESFSGHLPPDPQAELIRRIARGFGWIEAPGNFPTAETHHTPINPEDIRQGCLGILQETFNHLERLVAVNVHIGSLMPHREAALLVTTLVQEAAATEDQPTVARCVDVLARLSQQENASESRDIEAVAYFTGAMIGNERAASLLGGILGAENRQNEQRAVRREPLQTPALNRIISSCIDNDIFPAAWINTYAATTEHNWELWASYYTGLRRVRSTADIAATLEKKVAEDLIENPSHEFVSLHFVQILRHIESPDVRSRLVQRCMKALPHIDPNQPGLLNITDSLCTEILTQQTPALIRLLRPMVEHLEATLAPNLWSPLAFWLTSLKAVEGSTPQEIIAFLDEQAGAVMANASEEDQEVANLLIPSVRDTTLYKHATIHAQRGEFDAAQRYIYAIGEPKLRESAITMCIPYAKTPEQLDHLRPDETTLAVHPELHSRIKIAEALQAGNVDALANIAVEMVKTQGLLEASAQDGTLDKLVRLGLARGGDDAPAAKNLKAQLDRVTAQHVVAVYNTVAEQNPEHKIGLARQILDALRQQPNSTFRQTLEPAMSGELIRQQDPDETSRFYSLAKQSHPRRLIRIMRLLATSRNRREL